MMAEALTDHTDQSEWEVSDDCVKFAAVTAVVKQCSMAGGTCVDGTWSVALGCVTLGRCTDGRWAHDDVLLVTALNVEQQR